MDNCEAEEEFNIKHITAQDFGNYTLEVQINNSMCNNQIVQQDIVNTTTQIYIEVKSSPWILSLSAPPVIIPTDGLANVTAICVIRAFPRPFVTWSFIPHCLNDRESCQNLPELEDIPDDASEIFHESPGNKWKVVLRFSTKEECSLRCNATNNLGNNYTDVIVNATDYSQPEFLNTSGSKNGKKIRVEIGKNIGIECIARGNPNPIITWYKNSVRLDDTGSRLDRTRVLPEDSGNYTCEAKNHRNYKSIRRTVILEVIKPTSKGLISGLIITGVLIFIMVIIVIKLCWRVKKEVKFRRSFRQNALYLFEEGDVGALNKDCTADEQAQLLPYDKVWEVPKQDISLGKLLGQGAFGIVLKAEVKNLDGEGSTTTVAVKKCKSNTDHEQIRAFALELKIMIHLGKHLNIVNLMGANTSSIGNGELMILVEYCPFGSLLQFMKKNRDTFVSQVDSITGKFDSSITKLIRKTTNRKACNNQIDENGYIVRSDLRKVSQESNSQNDELQIDSFGLEKPRLCMANPGYAIIVGDKSSGLNDLEEEAISASVINTPHIKGDFECGLDVINYSSNTGTARIMNSDCSYMSMSTRKSSTDTNHRSVNEVDLHQNYIPMSENNKTPGKDRPFTTSDLICWSWQIASGMDYLSHRKIMHGDLATRNILLAENNVVKISDFGLSRDIYKKDIYTKKGDDLLPIKWMSIEAIRDRTFSIQSDVWSYGVTVWEIFTLGSTPYPDVIISQEFLSFLEAGHRMDMPRYGNEDLYSVLLECWSEDPRHRPDFNSLGERMGELLQPEQRMEYLKMNDPYIQMNRDFFSERTDYLKMLSSPDYNNIVQVEKEIKEDSDTVLANKSEFEDANVSYEPDEGKGRYLPMDIIRNINGSQVFSTRPTSNNEEERFSLENTDEDVKNPLKNYSLKGEKENMRNSEKNEPIDEEYAIEERGRFTVMKSEYIICE